MFLGFVKATKFRDSKEFSEYVQGVLAKSCLPCQCLYVDLKKFPEGGTVSPTLQEAVFSVR